MTLVPYFLTVNLTVSCVFILTFAFVAIQERNYAAPRWFTLASIAAALVAIFGYWIPLAENPRLLVLASFSLLMAAFLAITIGLQKYLSPEDRLEILWRLLPCSHHLQSAHL